MIILLHYGYIYRGARNHIEKERLESEERTESERSEYQGISFSDIAASFNKPRPSEEIYVSSTEGLCKDTET